MKQRPGEISYEEMARKLRDLGLTDRVLTRARIQQIEAQAMAKLRKLAFASRVLTDWRSER